MHGPVVTKADFYEACERYFPEHDIVFTHSRISDRRFTDCMVGEKLVMRYCPPDKYDVPQTIILFPEGEEPLRCMLQEELWDILKNLHPLTDELFVRGEQLLTLEEYRQKCQDALVAKGYLPKAIERIDVERHYKWGEKPEDVAEHLYYEDNLDGTN